MRRRATLSGLTLVMLAALAPAAQAGTYSVYACDSAGRSWQNRSWSGVAANGIAADTDCSTQGSSIGHSVKAGTNPIPDGAAATTTFTAAPGTTIADFNLTRSLTYRNPVASGTHKLYAIYKLGGTVFAGAGNFDDATRDRLNAQSAGTARATPTGCTCGCSSAAGQ